MHGDFTLGTGCAPFRSLIEERVAQSAGVSCSLALGERKREASTGKFTVWITVHIEKAIAFLRGHFVCLSSLLTSSVFLEETCLSGFQQIKLKSVLLFFSKFEINKFLVPATGHMILL